MTLMTLYFDYAIMRKETNDLDDWGFLPYQVTREQFELIRKSYRRKACKFLSDDKSLSGLTDTLNKVFVENHRPFFMEDRYLIFAYPWSIKDNEPFRKDPAPGYYEIIDGYGTRGYNPPEELLKLLFDFPEDDIGNLNGQA